LKREYRGKKVQEVKTSEKGKTQTGKAFREGKLESFERKLTKKKGDG